MGEARSLGEQDEGRRVKAQDVVRRRLGDDEDAGLKNIRIRYLEILV